MPIYKEGPFILLDKIEFDTPNFRHVRSILLQVNRELICKTFMLFLLNVTNKTVVYVFAARVCLEKRMLGYA